MPTSKLKLPDSVSSPQDIAALITELRLYTKWASHTLIKQRVSGKAVTGATANVKTGTDSGDEGGVISETPLLSPGATQLLSALANGQTLTQDKLDDLIAELQDTADLAPTLTITLAAPPSGGVKKTLVAWCRANIAPDVLVSFSFNATLLGGMVMRYGSHIYDWSFRRQILDNRDKFPEVLRRI